MLTSTFVPSSVISSLPNVTPSSTLLVSPNPRRRILTSPMAATAKHDGTAAPVGDPAAAKRVVVCGGGVIGACTAYFLATTAAGAGGSGGPVQVTVVEKSSVACAASGKAGGFLALDWCDGGPLSALARASFQLHRALSEDLDGPTSYGYRPLDTLSLAFFPSSAGKRGGGGGGGATRSSSSSSLPAWVDGPAAATPRTIGTVETTAQVHPQLFTRKLMSVAAEEHGVEVLIGEVERVEVEGGRASGVVVRLKSEEGEGTPTVLRTDAVVLAMGPWSARLPLINSLCRVSGLKAHSIVLRPQNPDAITPHALFLSYVPSPGARALDPEVYPRPTGEVYICGMSRDSEVPDDPEQITGDGDAISMLHEIAGTVSSQLKTAPTEGGGSAQVVAEQACFLPCSEDGLPVIGQIPGVEGCYVATGHSCWGILNGPATGKAMAELVLEGRATTVDLAPFSPARFLKGRGRR